MRLPISCLLLVLGAAVGCGSTNGGPMGAGGSGGNAGTGGGGGNPLAEQSTYRLSCAIDTLVLEIPVDLSFELDRPYTDGGSADLTFSAAITFEEKVATALIDAGFSKIDIVSLEIATRLTGAMPPLVEASLAAAPINDFDLAVDTDDNGVPGPHRIELDPVVVATTVIEGADEVELDLGLDQVSVLLGDVQVPTDCLGPTLVGFSARFPVKPPE